MEKITLVAKGYEGNEWVKSLAQSGLPQINKQLISPWGLYTESLLTHGVQMPALPFEAPVGIFIMLKILKNNEGGYFTTPSYRDAEIAYQAIQTLRNQYVGAAIEEVEGISDLLLPGILNQKNEAIIKELLIPYLDALKNLGLWDLPALYHNFIERMDENGIASTKRKGKGILIQEDPLSPLESAFVKALYPENSIEIQTRDSIFCHKPWETQGKKEIFKAYGSYNEWREVLDRIIQSNQPYDEFLLGSPQEQRIAHFMKEQSFVPYTLAGGFESQCLEIEKTVKKRKAQALRAGFIKEELPAIENDINDSLRSNRVDMANSQSGKIHLSQINSLPLIYRKNVYIMGLEAYTGSQMENSILLDGDIKNIREKVATSDLRTSVEKTRQIIRDFRWTVDLMIKQNRNVTLSYSYYDTAQLKIQAKPAAISPFEEAFTLSEDAGYFSDRRIPLSKDEANGLIYYSGKLSGSRQIDNQKEEGLGDLEALRISATRAETLIQCPYRFALENIIDMEIEERVIDITRWLDPMEMGTLCHQIFANYHQQTEKSATIEDDNLLMDKIYKDVVDSWLTRKPPSVDPQRQLKEIKTITQNYVILKNSYGKNNFLAAERLFEAAELIPEKLSIYGRADLVEENLEGLTVVDVKTGRRVGQTDQDIKTCIQAILYCLLLEREGNSIPVTGGYYLYPRTQRVVSCDYNLEAQEKAVDLLKQAINAIETGNGWKTDEKEVCEYCAYEKICNQKNKRRFFQRLIEEGVIS
jgi:CRISPR/Cas system-associated exonuclease Cas4 (RecB family)